MRKMKFLSLFSGIGGFDLGLERAGMECAGQVEIDPFCQRVLAYHWPHVKRMGDIYEVKGIEFGIVGLVCGGFPCQPFSQAGQRKGAADNRYLWPEMFRIITACRPGWVLGENVVGITQMELDNVLSDLESEGYETRAFIIPACAVDARHERKRVWIVAHADRDRDSGRRGPDTKADRIPEISGEKVYSGMPCGTGEDVADTDRPGRGKQRRTGAVQQEFDSAQCACQDGAAVWLPEPGVGRVADGIPGRVERLRGLGNAVVPQIVEIIGRYIIEAAERINDQYDPSQNGCTC